MPEATDLLVRRGEMTSGFWIRRVAPAKPARLVSAGDIKENVPRAGLLGPTPRRRRPRARMSPLPEWYPRTPLRDITAIVNALERRRLRVQTARAAQANRGREASPENPTTSPLPQESSVADQPLPIPSTPLPQESSVADQPLLIPSTTSSPSQTDHSPINMKQIETEEKLCRSIDQIEKIVKNNLKKTLKEASSKRVMQRRTLMSMR